METNSKLTHQQTDSRSADGGRDKERGHVLWEEVEFDDQINQIDNR